MSYFCPDCKNETADGSGPCARCGAQLVKLIKRSLIGKELDGKFTIKSLLGRGGMGEVYLAHQINMDREVAIKVLAPEFASDENVVARFHQEVRAISKLSHANCIIVHDFGQTRDDLLYIVMEYLEGRPLSKLIRDEAPLPMERTVRLVTQICDALGEAHQKGIIHRDLKSDNIFVISQYGRPDFVKVLDFSIAKLPASESNADLTRVGIIIGTPSYMSPEQAQSLGIDARTDLYALGVLLFELLSGERPYSGETPVAVLVSHVHDPIPSIREVVPHLNIPVEVEAFLRRAMAKKPADRPDDAASFKQELLRAFEQGNQVWATPGAQANPFESQAEIRTELLGDTPTAQVSLPGVARTPTGNVQPPPSSDDVDRVFADTTERSFEDKSDGGSAAPTVTLDQAKLISGFEQKLAAHTTPSGAAPGPLSTSETSSPELVFTSAREAPLGMEAIGSVAERAETAPLPVSRIAVPELASEPLVTAAFTPAPVELLEDSPVLVPATPAVGSLDERYDLAQDDEQAEGYQTAPLFNPPNMRPTWQRAGLALLALGLGAGGVITLALHWATPDKVTPGTGPAATPIVDAGPAPGTGLSPDAGMRPQPDASEPVADRTASSTSARDGGPTHDHDSAAPTTSLSVKHEGPRPKRADFPATAAYQAELKNWNKLKKARERAEKKAAKDQAAEARAAAKALAAKQKEEREKARKEKAQARKEKAAKDRAARDQAARDQAAKDQAAKDQAAKDQAAKDQAAKDQAAKDQAARDQAAKDQAAKDQAAKDDPTNQPGKPDAGPKKTLLPWFDDDEKTTP